MGKRNSGLLETNTIINKGQHLKLIIEHRINITDNMNNLFYKKNGVYNTVIALKCMVYIFTNNAVLFMMNSIPLHSSLINFTSLYKIRVLSVCKGFIKYYFHNSLYHGEVIAYCIKYCKTNSLLYTLGGLHAVKA